MVRIMFVKYLLLCVYLTISILLNTYGDMVTSWFGFVGTFVFNILLTYNILEDALKLTDVNPSERVLDVENEDDIVVEKIRAKKSLRKNKYNLYTRVKILLLKDIENKKRNV